MELLIEAMMQAGGRRNVRVNREDFLEMFIEQFLQHGGRRNVALNDEDMASVHHVAQQIVHRAPYQFLQQLPFTPISVSIPRSGIDVLILIQNVRGQDPEPVPLAIRETPGRIFTGNRNLDQFINDPQNTHDPKVLKEVEATIRRIEKRYADIDVKATLRDLKENIESVKNVAYFANKYGRISLCYKYMVVTGWPNKLGPFNTIVEGHKVDDKIYNIKISKLLALAWKLINDPDTFCPPKETVFASPQAREKEWQKDRLRRRDTLFNSLNRIIEEDLCPTGTYHDLVDAVNGTSPDTIFDHTGNGAVNNETKRMIEASADMRAAKLAEDKLIELFNKQNFDAQVVILCNWNEVSEDNPAAIFLKESHSTLSHAVTTGLKEEKIDNKIRSEAISKALDNIVYLEPVKLHKCDALTTVFTLKYLVKLQELIQESNGGVKTYQDLLRAYESRYGKLVTQPKEENVERNNSPFQLTQDNFDAIGLPVNLFELNKLAQFLQSRGVNSENRTYFREKLLAINSSLIQINNVLPNLNSKNPIREIDNYFKRYLREGSFSIEANKKFIQDASSQLDRLFQWDSYTNSEKRLYIATNLVIAISVIGLIILAIRACYSYAKYHRVTLFNHPNKLIMPEIGALDKSINGVNGLPRLNEV